MQAQTLSEYTVGDVIEDSYGNPAVIIQVQYPHLTLLQTVGSDRGSITSKNVMFRGVQIARVTGERAERAREIAREEWRKQHLGRRYGQTR